MRSASIKCTWQPGTDLEMRLPLTQEFGQCIFGGHCYAKFGVFCPGNGHGLPVDGSKHGIDDRLRIARPVTARKG